MYKRRIKPGGFGIVRTTTSTIHQTPNSISSLETNAVKTTKTQQLQSSNTGSFNDPPSDDPDEVLSDPEPTPKKSRTFMSKTCSSGSNEKFVNISSISQRNNTKPTKTKDLNNSSCVGGTPEVSNPEPTPKKSRTLMSKTSPIPVSNNITQRNISKKGNPKDEKNSVTSLDDYPEIRLSNAKSQPNKKISQHLKAYEDTKIKKKTNKNNKNSDSYLYEIFENSGLILSDGSSPNTLRTDQAIFIRDVRNAITHNPKDRPRNVENIMKDLEEYCNNDKCFKFAITITETDSECDVPRGATQDCLMRLLLHIDCLQARVTEMLLDRMAKIVMDDTADAETPVISWVRMILNCFRFLDRMDDSASVNERLLDVIQAASDVTVQQEIILSLPDIITDVEHHSAALELSKMVRKCSPQLMVTALEALTNLSLQPEVRTLVQPLLMKSLPKAQPEYLPTILKFLFTDCDSDQMDEIVGFLRCQLDLTSVGEDQASVQVLVCTTLRDALLATRSLQTVWLRNISALKVQMDHKPLDIIMLIVILSTSNDLARQKAIETIFRNKIRSDLFTEALIDETLSLYVPVIKEYFQVTNKLAGALLRSTEPAVVDFATKMYIGMFVHMDGLWCKWVVSSLQGCVGTGDSNVARSALSVLQHLTTNHLSKIKPLGVILMPLLNSLNDLALSEVCQLMDVLCHISFAEDSSALADCSILQDEISILVHKQLSTSQICTLRNGVIGCVMTIKHTASVSDSSSEPSHDETTEKAKKASQLLELLLTSTRNSVEAHGLALDQLSHLLIGGIPLDTTFIEKLSSLMRDTLQDAFLMSAADFVSKEDVLKSSLQFNLDEADSEGAIALNLSKLVIQESNPSHKLVLGVSCLHPLLRLLRGLELADLSEIDALLGCAIAMPVPSTYTEFSQLTSYQQHVALHCAFHCINWLIEIINCFAFLIKQNEPEKVLARLRTVVWLRDMLARCLPMAVRYIPPLCHFQPLPKMKLNADKPAKKGAKKKGRKKGSKKQDVEESVMTGNINTSRENDEDEQEVVEEEKRVADLTKYKLYFRELDIDVWLVLTQPFTLSPAPEKAGVFTPELGPCELLFLLEDYVTKLSRAVTTSNKRFSFLKTAAVHNVGFENLDKFTPLHIVKNTIKLMPYLCSFLEKTIEYTQNLVKINDGVFDSTGMFLDGSAEIKKCQGKLFRILAILFSWVGFQNQVNANYLLLGLQKLSSRSVGEQAKGRGKQQLVRDSVQYLSQYLSQCHPHVLDLTSAITLVDAIKALAHHAEDDPKLSTDIASICEELLKRRWYDMTGSRERGAALNSQVGELLNCCFSHSADQLSVVTSAVKWLATESQQLTEKDSTLETFPSFSKPNLHLLIGGLLRGLEGGVKQALEGRLTDRDQLVLWSTFTLCLETMVSVVKANDSKPNLRAFMKGCTSVLRLFLTQGIPICTSMFKREAEVVSKTLKKLQVTTRYIQTICNHVKVSKEVGLTQFLPPIRAVMEAILLRVKSIMVINNCTDAFFMGSMKNRNLNGEEIPSQLEIDPENDGEVEVPPNEDSDDNNDNNDDEDATDDEVNDGTGESVTI